MFGVDRNTETPCKKKTQNHKITMLLNKQAKTKTDACVIPTHLKK